MNEYMVKYKDKGFTVLGFPCNQFGLQENCKNEEIPNMVKHFRPGNGFVPNFPLSRKIDVNGEGAHPLYKFLRTAFPDTPPTTNKWVINQKPMELAVTPCQPGDLQWNFEKFICNREGRPVKRIQNSLGPDVVSDALKEMLV